MVVHAEKHKKSQHEEIDAYYGEAKLGGFDRKGVNVESLDESRIRHEIMPFKGVVSPKKGAKEISENTHEVEPATRSPMKPGRFAQVRPSTKDEAASSFDSFDEPSLRQYWREFFHEQKSKVKHLIGSVDKNSLAQMDSELKVTLPDLFASAEYINQLVEDAETTITELIDLKQLTKIHRFSETKDAIIRQVSIFQSDLQQVKASIYYCKRFQVQEQEQNTLKDHFEAFLS